MRGPTAERSDQASERQSRPLGFSRPRGTQLVSPQSPVGDGPSVRDSRPAPLRRSGVELRDPPWDATEISHLLAHNRKSDNETEAH